MSNDDDGVLVRLNKFEYRFDLIDPAAMFRLAAVMHQGLEKGYPKDNWRKIPIDEHVNHALMHIYAWLAGDCREEHLAHAFCRLMFATSLEVPDAAKTSKV